MISIEQEEAEVKTAKAYYITDKLKIVFPFLLLSFLSVNLGIAGEFSADLVLKDRDAQKITGRIFVQDDKIRQEILEEGEKQVMIFRPDIGVIWLITPEEEMYIEMPYQTDNKRFEKWSAERENNAKFIGAETISGFSCKKYETEEEGEKTYFWVSDKVPLPLKVQYKDGSMEYKNIKQVSLPASLFEVPAEYTKMVMPVLPESLGGSSP
jgi:hypothetical protein